MYHYNVYVMCTKRNIIIITGKEGLVGRHWSLFDDVKHGGRASLSVLICTGLEAMEV